MDRQTATHIRKTTGNNSESGKPDQRKYRLAVIGNPNTGKTTLFNVLTGLSQHTGNYPGVTVETALGEFREEGARFLAVDLPGTYSLAPRAPDEMTAVTVLLGTGSGKTPPDIILCVVDATNLDRNLYLLTQILDLGKPTVVALTMVDLLEKRGDSINTTSLSAKLGIPVIPVHPVKQLGLAKLREVLRETAANRNIPARAVLPSTALQEEAQRIRALASQSEEMAPLPQFLAERLIIDADGMIEGELVRDYGTTILDYAKAARARLGTDGIQQPQLEVERRYRWIDQVTAQSIVRSPSPGTDGRQWAKHLDNIITHKFWGVLIFLAVMGTTFQSIFSWAAPFIGMIDRGFVTLASLVATYLSEGPLQSLVVDGVIGGVGAVVAFVPQIAVLFGLIAILEDSGYMARAAFLMDRVMAGFGLSGRSFIPLLSSFACAVPGIMAARTIDDRRDRITTILIAPLMSCSARLPVYVLLISAFIPDQKVLGIFGLQGLTLFGLYCLGLVIAPPIAWALKRSLLKGEPVPFLMEIPPFKMPALRVVSFRMYERSRAFLTRAGSIILATTILVWALSYYPTPTTHAIHSETVQSKTSSRPPVGHDAGGRLRQSYLGRAGQMIEPFVKPLGWDWKIGVATLASFPAREVVIAALGTIYNVGSEHDAGSLELRSAMKAERWPDGRVVYTPAVALSVMVFFALCCQCGATLATIKRETNSWGYPVFTFLYMTGLAYVAALATYQIGTWLGR